MTGIKITPKNQSDTKPLHRKNYTTEAVNKYASYIDTVVAFRRLRQELPDQAFIMPLTLSLSPLPVTLCDTKHDDFRLTTRIAALIGPTGCLPPLYEELAISEARNRNLSLADFIALFHKRLADFYIEATIKYSAHHQRRWQSQQDNRFNKVLLALSGCAPININDKRRAAIIGFSPFFADSRRNAACLKLILENIFSVPIKIIEFTAHWHPIQKKDLTYVNGLCRLGVDATIGRMVKNAANNFRILVGPLSFHQFSDFLPDTPAAQQLVDLVRLYCGIGLQFDVQLIICKEESGPCRLAASGRLGRDIWLANHMPAQDRDDTIFHEKTIPSARAWDKIYAS